MNSVRLSWNARMFSLGYTSKNMELIEFELKETKFAKSFKRKVAKIYLDSYASYICKKENCLSKLLPPNILYIKMISITYVTLCSNPSAEYYPFLLNFITPPYFIPDLSSLSRRIEFREGAIGFPCTLLWRFWTAEELVLA